MKSSSFDQYEYAKVVEIYMRTKAFSPYKKGKEIKALSAILREYAISRGLNIDENYRSVLGLRMLFSNCEYIETSGALGLGHPSRLARDMMKLYRENRSKFDEILHEANIRMGVTPAQRTTSSSKSASKTTASPKDVHTVLKKVRKRGKLNQVLNETKAPIQDNSSPTQTASQLQLQKTDLNKPLTTARKKEDTPAEKQERSKIVQKVVSDAIKEETVLPAIDLFWDRPMTAAVVARYFELKDMEPSEWDQSIRELTEQLQQYIERCFSPAISRECTFWNVAARISAIHSIHLGTGKIGETCTESDVEMFRMYQSDKKRFQKFMAEFCVWLGNAQKDRKQIVSKPVEKIAAPPVQKEPDNDSISAKIAQLQEINERTQENGNGAWDVFETAKLVEMCIQIQTKDSFMDDIRQLSRTVTQYAERRGVLREDDTSRTVYGINIRTQLIDYLLSGGSKGREGATQTEAELVKLYQEQQQLFQKVVDEANRRMKMAGEIAEKKPVPEKQETAKASKKQETRSTTDTSIEGKCLQLLRDNFPKGIRLASSLDRKRFYNFYSEKFGEELSVDELGFNRILNHIGTEQDGRIVAQSGEDQTRLLEEICREVTDILDSGVSCVFLESLFDRHKQQVESLLQIYQDEDLEPILRQKLGDGYTVARQKKQGATICLQGGKPNPDEDVKKCLLKHGTSMTYTEMEKEIWHLPFRRVRQTINATPSIICTDDKTYMAVELFPVGSADLEKIRGIIGRRLAESQTGRITDEDCRRMVEKELPSLASDLQGFTLRAFQNALSFLLKDDFSFSTHIISRKHQHIDSYRIYREFCEEHEKCTLDDLQELSKEMNVPISWETIREQMIRINEEEFWQKNLLHFDVPYVDGLLEQYCQDAYLPLAHVRSFLHFPAMETGWTPYLLESYLYAGGSKKFTLLHARFADNNCTGVIVRKEAKYDDYTDLLVDVLTYSKEWIDRETALEFLVSEGYLNRRRYEKLDEVMRQARLAREKMNK